MLSKHRWIELETDLVRDASDGLVLLSSVIDVSARETLACQNRNLNQIIDAIPNWIFVKSTDHKYVRVNQACSKVYGYAPEECVGKTSIELGVDQELALGNPEKEIKGFYADDNHVFATGETLDIPSEPVSLGNETMYLHTVKVPIFDELNERQLLLGVSHDITYLKEIEEKIGIELQHNKTLNEVNEILRGLNGGDTGAEQICRATAEALSCSGVAIELDDDMGTPVLEPASRTGNATNGKRQEGRLTPR